MSRNRRNIRGRRINISGVSKHIKIILPIFIIIVCITILIIKMCKTNAIKIQEEAFNSEIFNANIELTEEEKETVENESKRDVTLSVAVTGDILCENDILNSVKNKDYNFENIFSDVKKHTIDADLTLVPVETNFVNQDYSGNINYNSPKSLAKEIRNLGTDIAFLANNHSLDYGINGINETINSLKETGLETVGTNTGENENRILIKEYRNIKMAFLSYTYGTNKREEGYDKYINLANKEIIESDILKAREEGAEYIIVSMHWGDVASARLTSHQNELSEFLINSGVDIILGNHPSSIQKMETRLNNEGKDVLIVYSMGNFISSENYQNYNLGMILKLELVKLAVDNKVYLNKVTYVPTYIQDNGAKAEDRYKILDIKEEISNYENGIQNIDEKTYNKLKQALVKIKELISG